MSQEPAVPEFEPAVWDVRSSCNRAGPTTYTASTSIVPRQVVRTMRTMSHGCFMLERPDPTVFYDN
jgi:hypothetical protein